MSNATLMVRFKDGLILWGIYHGTSDIAYPGLFDSMHEAWAYGVHERKQVCRNLEEKLTKSSPEPVEIHSDYGCGWYWGGEACRNTKMITSNLSGYRDDEDVSRDRLFTDDWANKPVAEGAE